MYRERVHPPIDALPPRTEVAQESHERTLAASRCLFVIVCVMRPPIQNPMSSGRR
jgi:hypothetical protein